MRLLVFADLHLDAPFRWAGPDLARRRRQALRGALSRICVLADQERVDAVLCAGDLYEHDRFSPDTVSFVAQTLNSLPVPVFLAPGNHDWLGPSSLYAQAPFASHVHLFTADRLVPVELTDGLTLWGAAHRAPANTDGFLDGFTVDRGGVNLALMHASERGSLPNQTSGKVPHAPFHEPDVSRSGLDHAFCGHFHTPRHTERVTYPGNPEPLTFGESGDRGAVIAEVSASGAVDREVRSVATSEVHDLAVTLDGASHAGEIRAQVEAALAPLRGIARVTLAGEISPDAELDLTDLHDVGTHLDAVVTRVGEVRVGYDIDHLAGERTVRGQFVRDVLAADDLDEGTRRRVLVTGLRALAGRDDLAVS